MVKFIDFEQPERNDFLAISQFRVDRPGTSNFIQPDIVLFVNGIPLVVVECKNPAATAPMEKAINDLLLYSNQRDWVDGEEGVEKLFHYNQLMVGTFFNEARVGTVGCEPSHFLEWKDTEPGADGRRCQGTREDKAIEPRDTCCWHVAARSTVRYCSQFLALHAGPGQDRQD